MKLFEDLQLYQLVMIVIGAALAIVLIVKFAQGKLKAAQMPLFLVPIVMIGFPTVKVVEFAGARIELQEQANYVSNHPDDQAAKEKLASMTASFEERAGGEPDDLLLLADANAALGRWEKAWVQAEIAAAAPSAPPQANEKLQSIGTRIIAASVPKSGASINDTATRQLLTTVAETLPKQPTVKPETLAAVASADLALGRTDQVQKNVKRAQTLNPTIKIRPEVLNAVREN